MKLGRATKGIQLLGRPAMMNSPRRRSEPLPRRGSLGWSVPNRAGISRRARRLASGSLVSASMTPSVGSAANAAAASPAPTASPTRQGHERQRMVASPSESESQIPSTSTTKRTRYEPPALIRPEHLELHGIISGTERTASR